MLQERCLNAGQRLWSLPSRKSLNSHTTHYFSLVSVCVLLISYDLPSNLAGHEYTWQNVKFIDSLYERSGSRERNTEMRVRQSISLKQLAMAYIHRINCTGSPSKEKDE